MEAIESSLRTPSGGSHQIMLRRRIILIEGVGLAVASLPNLVKNRKNQAPGLDHCMVPFPLITKLFVRFIEQFERNLSNHPIALQVEVHIR
jgi:hypothetical protein